MPVVVEVYTQLLTFTFKQMIMYGGPGTNRIKRWSRTLARGGPAAWQEVRRFQDRFEERTLNTRGFDVC